VRPVRRNLKQKWISDDIWMCTEHIPAPRIPSVQDKCWYCGAARPLLEGRVVKPYVLPGSEPPPKAKKAAKKSQKEGVSAQIQANNTVGATPCAWPGCPNKSAGKSKYCSRECSNKNARSRHAHRKDVAAE